MPRTAYARIEERSETNDYGNEQEYVVAICHETGVEGPKAWGTSDASRKRALAQLAEICYCGTRRFHKESR